MRESGRRAVIAAALAAAALGVAASTALAAPATIVGGSGGSNVFDPDTYTIDQGETATLQYSGGAGPHNVTANRRGPDGRPLFRSATIGGGSTAVRGVQYLTAGTYAFRCTVHIGMTGTLVVGAAGQPAARPNLRVAVLRRRLARVRRTRRLPVRLRGIVAATGVTLIAKRGRRVLGRRRGVAIGAGRRRQVVIVLSRRARRILRGRRARVTVVASVPFGSRRFGSRLLR